jgi:NADP-dependent 3-hydroxy acid dehydrogenase YdfG
MINQNHVVVITGASAGIGQSTARAFARCGCHLVIGARREERLAELTPQLQDLGAASVLALPLDVRQADSVKSFYTAFKAKHEACDVLVNNAGLVLGVDHIADGNFDDWETILDTNVMGVLRMCRTFLPDMKTKQKGHVIMIGSISGHQVYEGGGPYCATKHAVNAITRTLKLELNGTNIRVSSIDPGLVETEFSVVRLGSESQAKKVYDGLTPLTGDDIAECVVFAASRPPHVNIDEMIVMPTAQAAVHKVHRESSNSF